MAFNWIPKVVEGGGDGLAQIRSDAHGGVKLGDQTDGYEILVDTLDIYNGWQQVRKPDRTLIFPKDQSGNAVTENWIEVANTRDPEITPPPPPDGETVKLLFVSKTQTPDGFVYEFKKIT